MTNPEKDDLPQFVDKYLKQMNYAPNTTEWEKKLIRGQLQAFANYMRAFYKPPLVKMTDEQIADFEKHAYECEVKS